MQVRSSWLMKPSKQVQVPPEHEPWPEQAIPAQGSTGGGGGGGGGGLGVLPGPRKICARLASNFSHHPTSTLIPVSCQVRPPLSV